MAQLLEFRGISMAPFLRPGDIVWVDERAGLADLRFGDVAVFRHRATGEAMAHRVIGPGPVTKGDRNREPDPPSDEWAFEGVAVRRYRSGRWSHLRFGRALALLSCWGLFPGQKLPSWLSRTSLRRRLGR
jgi:hypothetical protein